MRTNLLVPVLLAAALAAQSEPPIRVVMDLHMDPMNAIPVATRKAAYQTWIADTGTLLDALAPYGSKLSFASVGEFMEYCIDDGAAGVGCQFLRRVYALGETIGSHSHTEYQSAAHQWLNYMGNVTLAQAQRAWTDNLKQVDAAITLALGSPLPKPIREICAVRGAHIPSNETDFHTLMSQNQLSTRAAGPGEDFYALFTQYCYHPFRPSKSNVLDEDLTSAFVYVPHGSVMGIEQVHKNIFQDCTIAAAKVLFLQCYASWRRAERLSLPDKIWVVGHGSHGSDVTPNSVTRLGWIEYFRWLNASFAGKTGKNGSPILRNDTHKGVADAYRAWETLNPGRSMHRYPLTTRSWAWFPWLRPVAEELGGARLVSEPALAAGLSTWVMDKAGSPRALLCSDTSSGTVDLAAHFTGEVHVTNAETGRFLGSDKTKVPFGLEATIVAPGFPFTGVSGTPQLGQQLGFEVQGFAGGQAVFALGAGQTNVSLGALGTLYVDLAQPYVITAPIALDAQGAGSLSMIVPGNPALSGARMYLQALSYLGVNGKLAANVTVIDLR